MSFFEELFSLKGQVAIVTGGRGDLGSEYARVLSLSGAKVASFDIKPIGGAAAATDGKILEVKVDITNKKSVASGFAEVIKFFGDTPTILINNAGLNTHPNASAKENGPFEEYPEESWDAMLDSHLKGMFIVTQEFIKKYRAAKKINGSIVNISSTYGVVAPEQAIYDFRRKKGEQYFKPIGYSVAKSGVLNFTRWLADYCAYEKLGLRVNTLVPGGVLANQDPEFVKEYTRRTMLGRMANRTDYNGALLFLASNASAYMTGSALVVDGGWTAR